MPPIRGPSVTELLVRWSGGDASARDALVPLVYGELRRIARATLAVSSLPAGVASLTAAYNGDSRYATSTSLALDETIKPASSTTTLSSSRNPSKVGQSVTFTAEVKTETGVSATGTVTFTAGNTTLGTANLAGGKARMSTSSLPRGANTITATYSGNADVEGSSATLSQQVN
jgi:Bacterial Ig-like domain (group 3)